MTNEELIQKLRGLQRYGYDQCTDVLYECEEGIIMKHDDIEELINELEKPELFCETVKAPTLTRDQLERQFKTSP